MSAAFRCKLAEFAATSADEKLGKLIDAAGRSGFVTQHLSQIPAWQTELEVLGECISTLLKTQPEAGRWEFLLEYSIPRRAKRPDAVLLADDLIFVLEFKIGANSFDSVDKWQVLSYALDLRDFHAESAARTIVPILIATGDAVDPEEIALCDAERGRVLPVEAIAGKDGAKLARRIRTLYDALHDSDAATIDANAWEQSLYRPSLNIIEAAESLFAGHSVAGISHKFAVNLEQTTAALLRAIEKAQRERLRTICFVTGIPGAGKTLAGLNTVHDPLVRRDDRPAAVFLSGNGPLVKIVREALTRNRVAAGSTRKDAERSVSTFIANVHAFLDEYGKLKRNQAPAEHAVVFDEAQRAWNSEKMLKERAVAQSEPALLLEIMGRVCDWCVVIALVGGGQEINDGEGGLAEWGRALNASSTPWHILASREVMRGGASVAGHKLFDSAAAPHHQITESWALHLDVGVRSPRAGWLGGWVNELLAGNNEPTRAIPASDEFPICFTRDLGIAKEWLRSMSDKSQRYGLLASSGALRLRAHGIELSGGFRKGFSYPEWFLAAGNDCRSSNYLEVAATEFDCQGLELDWTCLCWGNDLVPDNQGGWLPRKFKGPRWFTVRKPADKTFVINKYRVLLTRARHGMVIWVPRGDVTDPTRSEEEFDRIASRLFEAGLKEIGSAISLNFARPTRANA